MPDKEVSKDMNKDADAVLLAILQSHSDPKKLYHPTCGFQYEYLQDLFKFIVERCPEFIDIYEGSKPLGYIQIRPNAGKSISKFIKAGGFGKFSNLNNYKAYQKKERKASNKMGFYVKGDMINSQVAIGGQASVLLEGNKTSNKIKATKLNAMTSTSPPLDNPDGWLKKLLQKAYENIGKIIIVIISGIILSLIKARCNLK